MTTFNRPIACLLLWVVCVLPAVAQTPAAAPVCKYLDGEGNVHYVNVPPDKAWGWKKLACDQAEIEESRSACARAKGVYDEKTQTCAPVPVKKSAQGPREADPDIPLILMPALATCGDWYAERRGEGKYRWETEVSWFQGFVAGHNFFVERPANKMIAAEPNDVALWLDTYCVKSPTDTLSAAAAGFIAAHGGRSFRQPQKTQK